MIGMIQYNRPAVKTGFRVVLLGACLADRERKPFTLPPQSCPIPSRVLTPKVKPETG